MPAPAPQLQAETVEHTGVFAVELFDPVTLQVVSRGGIRVTATFAQDGLWGPAISRGSRFVWMRDSVPDVLLPGLVPTSVIVTPPPGSGFAPFTYSAADIANGRSTKKYEWGLCRLPLRTTSLYPFPSGTTLARGVLRKVPDVGAHKTPLAGAQVWLQWQDAGANPVVAREGFRCLSGAQGEFAASLLFPSKASKSFPATGANGQLTLTLYVAQFNPAGVWQQAHLVPALSPPPNPLDKVRSGQVTDLAAPVVWSTLTPG
jgi:hypothetical protein